MPYWIVIFICHHRFYLRHCVALRWIGVISEEAVISETGWNGQSRLGTDVSSTLFSRTV